MLAPGSALALALAVASPATTAAAERDPISAVSIAWMGSPACDGGQALRAHLRRLLAASTAGSRVSGDVDVRLTPGPALDAGDGQAAADTWTMTLRIRSASGSWSRRIDGERCEQMIAVAALIAAIYLDPIAVQAKLAGDGATEATPEATPETTPETNADGTSARGPETLEASSPSPARSRALPPQPELAEAPMDPPQRAPEDWQASDERPTSIQPSGPARSSSDARRQPALGSAARAALLGSYGPFPGLGALLVGGVGMTIGDRALLELAVLHRLRSRQPIEATPEVELLASLTAARVHACWTPRLGALELPLCGGADLGALRVEALGLRNPELDRSLYVAPSIGGRLLWRPAPTIGLGLDLGASVALRRRTYGIRELDGPVLETTRAGAHAGLSLEVRLPSRKNRRP